MSNTKVDYHKYMASREWALKKEAVKERSGGVCERCHVAPHENTHHLTYERLGDEWLEDLQGVCRPCHEFLSAKRDDDPASWVDRPPFSVEKPANGDWGQAAVFCPFCQTDWVQAIKTRTETESSPDVFYSFLVLECRNLHQFQVGFVMKQPVHGGPMYCRLIWDLSGF